ncbi:MAG: ribosome recycling factor [Patescibacteria group bacterium]
MNAQQTFKDKLDAVALWLQKEYQTIRTGQASPAILDGITVEAYGVKTPLAQIAAVSIEGTQSLLVSPYDKNQIKQLEKAFYEADLGLSIVSGEAGVRVIFPNLTAERRVMLIKLAREKLEKARVSVRQERDSYWSDIQSQHKEGEISEDEKFSKKEEMEELVKGSNDRLDQLFKNKESEIKG